MSPEAGSQQSTAALEAAVEEMTEQNTAKREERAEGSPTRLKGDSLELAKLRAGISNGLSLNAVSLLAGETADELNTNAVRLAELLSTHALRRIPARPVAHIKTGQEAASGIESLDPLKLAKAMAARLSPK
ncbi:hypothetical protein ACIQWR_27360 [Streptomyces sp. NPDC098789]|uniref:hypothetical protein n=1 Tax=Streptomyces sp. NPDC098789 TaxID=3366098 RepID=UPI003812CB36